MPSSWLVRRLTGAHVLDHHSASQCTPLYDTGAHAWFDPWVQLIGPQLELPPLRWSGEAAGTVTDAAAARTGLTAGIPVTTGTIDAWAEAISVGAQSVGDLMLMYGTTMFLIHTVPDRLTHPSLWGTVGTSMTWSIGVAATDASYPATPRRGLRDHLGGRPRDRLSRA